MKEASGAEVGNAAASQLSRDLGGLSVSAATPSKGENAADSSAQDPFKDVPVLSSVTAELYLFDTDADVFIIQNKAVKVQTASNGPYDSQSCSSADCLMILIGQLGLSSDREIRRTYPLP